MDKSRFLVDIFSIPEQKLIGFSPNSIPSSENDPLILLVSSDLAGESSPNYIQPFPGNIVRIAKFSDEALLQEFLEKRESELRLSQLGVTSSAAISFTAKRFNPMGVLKNTSALSKESLRSKTSFVMVNSIRMKSFLNPLVPLRIGYYMMHNTRKLMTAGVVILTPLEVDSVLTGTYPYDVMFFTEWLDRESYDSFHTNPDFIKLARSTRNKAFSGFTESYSVPVIK